MKEIYVFHLRKLHFFICLIHILFWDVRICMYITHNGGIRLTRNAGKDIWAERVTHIRNIQYLYFICYILSCTSYIYIVYTFYLDEIALQIFSFHNFFVSISLGRYLKKKNSAFYFILRNICYSNNIYYFDVYIRFYFI